jgi:hypothetical protein
MDKMVKKITRNHLRLSIDLIKPGLDKSKVHRIVEYFIRRLDANKRVTFKDIKNYISEVR